MLVRYTGTVTRNYKKIGGVEPGDERDLRDDLAQALVDFDDWEPVEEKAPEKEEG
jgi:hypothetical protein